MSIGTELCGLTESVRWCQDVCRRSGSSFTYAFRFLDLPRRNAMYALYAFARMTDDLGDSAQPLEVRTACLETWRALLQQRLASGPIVDAPDDDPISQVFYNFANLEPALESAIDRFDIPRYLLEDIIAGVSLDLEHHPPVDWQELRQYCYHVASTVGLACVRIWRDRVPACEQPAIECGVAFQLTNILRDVAEDARRGRIYLPLSELERYRVDPLSWLRGEPSGDWRGLVDEVATQAFELYQTGWRTIEALSPQSRRMFSLMWHSYRQLLQQVVDGKDQLWSGSRIHLSTPTRLRLLTTHLVPPLYARIPQP